MDRMLFKKINLLVHLAHIDGQFVETEKNLLLELLQGAHLDEEYLKVHKLTVIDMNEIHSLPDKSELLYWVLKMIHADGVLHPSEVNYAKLLAHQLGFRDEVIDHFTTHPLESLARFEKDVSEFQLRGVL